jgi:uncharacterized protein YgbK (DUF1537 family)
VVAYDLDTRSGSARRAREVVRRAFSRRAAKRASILYKKIDSTLRGHVAAELGAVRRALGRRAIVFTPAFPAQGRSVRDAALHLRGRPISGDLRAVLGAREIRALRLLGEVEPGVPFGMARDGTLVCTKAGAFGSQGTLARCVARLTKEMRR